MVSVACVRCKQTVQARVDKLHHKLRCPHCGTLMHLREDGKWYEGVHPAIRGQSGPSGWRGLIARWHRRLAGLPVLGNRIVQTVTALAMIVVIVWLVSSSFDQTPIELPTVLKPRAAALGQAVLQGDERLFSELVDPDTGNDAEEWYDAVRDMLNRAPGQYQTITVEVVFENRAERIATTTCGFQSTSGGDRSYLLYWRLDHDGFWKLDGQRTLEEM